MHLTTLTLFLFFFFNDTATTEIYTLSLHDALPICSASSPSSTWAEQPAASEPAPRPRRDPLPSAAGPAGDRKSTRLNSSHLVISYAVFCLKKKKKLNCSLIRRHLSTLQPDRRYEVV